MQMTCLTVALVTIVGVGLCGAQDEYECDFAGDPDPALWALHQEGGALAEFSEGALLLDMTAPRRGKHAWADLLMTIKLPAVIEWDQQIARDAPHYYLSGLWLRDAHGAALQAGLTGTPAGLTVHFPGQARRAPRGGRAVVPLQP